MISCKTAGREGFLFEKEEVFFEQICFPSECEGFFFEQKFFLFEQEHFLFERETPFYQEAGNLAKVEEFAFEKECFHLEQRAFLFIRSSSMDAQKQGAFVENFNGEGQEAVGPRVSDADAQA